MLLVGAWAGRGVAERGWERDGSGNVLGLGEF